MKKYGIYLVSIILGIIAAINLSVAYDALKKVKYEVTIEPDNAINYIYINDNKEALFLYIDDTLEYNEENKSLVPNKKYTFTIETSKINKVILKFNNDNVVVKRNNIEGTINNNEYSFTLSKKEMIKQAIGLNTILFTILFSILFFICLKVIKKTIDKINTDNIKIRDIVLFIIVNFIIFINTIYILLSLLNLLVLLFIIPYIAYLLYKTKDNIKLKNSYIILGTIIGLTFMFLIPPCNVPDEATHFTKSYTMFDSKYNNDKGVATVDGNLGYFMTYYEYTELDPEVKFNGNNYLSQLLDNSKNNETYKKNYQNTKYVSKVPYLPSAIMVSGAKALTMPPLIMFMLGRLANLLVSIIMCYLALKATQKFDKVLFIIMLLPSFVQAQIGFNMDSMTNALAVLTVGYILKLIYQNNKINKKQIIILFILGIILSLCKFGYFPIMLLVLLIPKNKSFKKFDLIYKIILILLVFLISYKYNASGVVSSNAQNSFYTIPYLIQNPIRTIHVFYNTIVNNLGSELLIGHFNSYGTDVKHISNLFLVLFTIIYSLVLLMNNGEKLKLKERIIFLITSLLLLLIPYSAMLLCWTDKSSLAIAGLQTRYFIITIVPLYIGLSNNTINIKVKNKYLLYVMCALVCFTLSLYTILVEFY